MPKRTPEDISTVVEQQATNTAALRDRMRGDWNLYILSKFIEQNSDGEAVVGYRTYTSNEPRTFAQKILTWLTQAKVIPRIPYAQNHEEQRAINDTKEKFAVGLIREADLRLTRRIKPSIQKQIAFYAAIRGWIAGRALLRKDDKLQTRIEIEPWDPLNTFWAVGRDGLSWICYRTIMSKNEILDTYNVRLTEDGEDGDDGVLVYDYYDNTYNVVVTDEKVLKRSTRHGHPRVPGFVIPVGATPAIFDTVESTGINDSLLHYGESIFSSNRHLYEAHNLIMSVILELVARARKPPIGVRSPDGSKGLEEDPYREGSVLQLSREDEVEALNLLEMTKDAGAFMALVAAEMQRGALAHTTFGQIQFALSGFAINTLRQGIEGQVYPPLEAMEIAFEEIFSLISEHYVTNFFLPMKLSGVMHDPARGAFSQEFPIAQIAAGGDVQVSIVSSLPQDDLAKMQMAQIARDGQVPLYSDRYIWDNILGIQDADQMADSIKEQMGERASPVAMLYSLMAAAEKQGREDLAAIYYGDLINVLRERQNLIASKNGANGSAPPSPNGQNGQPTTRPEVGPNAQLGGLPPIPNPQGGPNVPPGSPRPGARENIS